MNQTKIEWCDSTWNPVMGCLNNCEYCYARRIAERFGGRAILINHSLKEPLARNGRKIAYPFGFAPTFHEYRLAEYQSKAGRNIFVCSMADLFGDWIPDEWIEKIFEMCKQAAQHNYMFLTKNPERYVSLDLNGKLLQQKNMWYGITVANKRQAGIASAAVEDITEAAGVFLSIEPILEDVLTEDLETAIANFVDWVIIGAETGNRKGKVIPRPEWIEKIVKVCDEWKIPVFMKDSLAVIVGEDNMRRNFPEYLKGR